MQPRRFAALLIFSLLAPSLLAASAIAAPGADPAATRAARTAFSGSDLSGKDGPLAKVGWDLALLSEEFRTFQARGLAPVQAFQPSNQLLRVENGRVLVKVIPSGSSGAVASELSSLGMQVTGTADHMVSGYLPISAIESVAGLADVATMSPDSWTTQVGAVTSQADSAMRSSETRAALGINGAGVTVGVLSDSYDFKNGAAADVNTGDLPGTGNPNGFTTPVNVLADGSKTDEGRGMLQLIHDVAPGAALAFATANGGQAAFAANITSLRTTAGAGVVVDDVIYYAEPMFQDGVVAQAADACNAAGVPYFSAALNQDRDGYQGAFRSGASYASSAFPSASGAPSFLGGTAHDFDPGAATDALQSFSLPDSATLNMSFQWDQPFASVSGAPGCANDLDVYIFNAAGDTVVGGSVNNNVGGDAVEVVGFQNLTGGPANFNIMLVLRSGSAPATMKYILFNFPGGINEWAGNAGTIFGHPNASGAVAVAAAPYFRTPAYGVNPPQVEGFSSSGTTPVLFTTAGAPTFDGRTGKPEICAVDGVNTTFFGKDADGDGWPNFFGTSAAAPNAAAVAALMFESVPGATPAQILSALEASAIDMGSAGFDNTTGYGLIQAPAALDALDPCVLTCPGDTTVGNDPGLCTAVVNFSATTSGNCGPVTCNPPSGTVFPLGTTTVTCTAFSGEICTFHVTVNDVEPPQITCPPPDTVECSASGGTPADDPQLNAFFAGVSASDNCGSPSVTNDAPSFFPDGTTPVIFTATDGTNAVSCTTSVTVVDTTPPNLTALLNRDCLWPPNGKMAEIDASITVSDVCDPNPAVVLESITSNEPDDGIGDGHTTGDIQIPGVGNPDTTFYLRSERQGGGDGRVYTVIYSATDASGNASYDTSYVRVPHDRSGSAICAAGFAADGAALYQDVPSYTLVIPSSEGFDASTVMSPQAYVGNLQGVVRPSEYTLLEATGDGRPDLVLTYDGDAVRRLRDASLDLQAGDGKMAAKYKPSLLGLHYRTAGGTDYLVANILSLGAPIQIQPEVPGSGTGDPGTPLDPIDATMAPGSAPGSARFVLPSEGPVRVEVYNVLGQRVRTLINDALPAGTHRIAWDRRNSGGLPVPNGIYFYRIEARGLHQVKKVVVVR